jgi:hypothetical protein
LSRGIAISAEHLPGASNTTADYQSRNLQSTTEWKLSSAVFQMISRRLDPCRVDLFASRLNTQLENYVSWKPGNRRFSHPVARIAGVCISPLLVDKCLSKLKQDTAIALLVAPVWPSQTWHPTILSSASTHVPRPPQRSLRPTTPHDEGRVTAACHVEAVRGRYLAGGLSEKATQLVTGALPQPISQHGKDGLAGVLRGTSIPFATE